MRDKGHRPAVRRNGWKLFKAAGVGESMCTYLVYDSFGGSDQTANKESSDQQRRGSGHNGDALPGRPPAWGH
jgi:hypothetical protein